MTAPRLAGLGALLLALAACGGPGGPAPSAPTDPEIAARSIFGLARDGEPSPDALQALFGPITDELEQARLLDALDALLSSSDPRIVNRAAEPGGSPLVLDIVAALPGGGEGSFSVGLAGSDAGWQVRWFHGPGVEWPLLARPTGEGLSALPPT